MGLPAQEDKAEADAEKEVEIESSKYDIRAYTAMQIVEINEHKWFLSEKRGYDVGYEETFRDWIRSHARRFRNAYASNIEDILAKCKERCFHQCAGIEGCVLSSKEIHKLLGDSYEEKREEAG